MGTRWRGLLAPIDTATGDGRRFLEFTNRTLPLPHRWQRADTQGHDDSVVVGLADAMEVLTVKDAIAGGWISEERAALANLDPDMLGMWGLGEFFDDVDPAAMPRLAQDVAEAMLLADKGVLGPSVGAGAAEVFGYVHPGTKTLITEEEYITAFEAGLQIDEELLFVSYVVAESTLVPVPAFGETSTPFEILTAEMALTAAARPPVAVAARVALVAAAAAPPVSIPSDVFDAPDLPDYQALTVEDRGEGFLRVSGYVAAFGVCHVEFRDACYTAPASQLGYTPFNRYPVTVMVEDGQTSTAQVGRVTTGLGRAGTGCSCCRGKDDHACNTFTLGRAIAHYDTLRTVAWVRATEIPDRGIWLSGYAPLSLAADERAVLGRGRVSGDWRDHGGHLEVIEALALAKEREGFPIPTGSGFAAGRQLSLVAAGRVQPHGRGAVTTGIDYSRLGREVAANLAAQGLTLTPTGAPVTTTTNTADGVNITVTSSVTAAAQVHTGAMVALVPTEDDAARLAVEGGEPATELHLTLAYLGEAADIPPETQAAIIDSLTTAVATMAMVEDCDDDAPCPEMMTDTGLQAEGFAVEVFNPADEDKDTAIVLGVSGPSLEPVHTATMEALAGAMDTVPTQHTPWQPHVTLIYSDDLELVAGLADLTGQPVTFNRLRVAFAGVVTDIPLTTPTVVADPVEVAAALLAELDLVLDVDAPLRAEQAALLLTDLEGLHV